MVASCWLFLQNSLVTLRQIEESYKILENRKNIFKLKHFFTLNFLTLTLILLMWRIW